MLAPGVVICISGAYDPIEYVECPVGPEGEEVEGVDDRRDGCLAEEQQLREDTDGFENL